MQGTTHAPPRYIAESNHWRATGHSRGRHFVWPATDPGWEKIYSGAQIISLSGLVLLHCPMPKHQPACVQCMTVSLHNLAFHANYIAILAEILKFMSFGSLWEPTNPIPQQQNHLYALRNSITMIVRSILPSRKTSSFGYFGQGHPSDRNSENFKNFGQGHGKLSHLKFLWLLC